MLYWGSIGDNGKENGNYYSIIGYILGFYWGSMEKKMETTIIGYILPAAIGVSKVVHKLLGNVFFAYWDVVGNGRIYYMGAVEGFPTENQ